MVNKFTLFLLALLLWSCAGRQDAGRRGGEEKALTKVAEFKGVQVTGVTVSQDGRIFACFPRWRENIPFSVVEVFADGTSKPYPDTTWNSWKGAPEKGRFTNVQSVLVHGNSLYVLDPANPMFKGVIGKPMLYEFDLATNKLKRTYSFSRGSAPRNSYLNDLRIDHLSQKAYITDSGVGAIVVLDLNSGKAWRVLDKHQSTKSENVVLKIEGRPFLIQGTAPKIHSDGIALSPDNQFLYYHALTGYELYSVPTSMLSHEKIKTEEIVDQVKPEGKTPAPDGMIFDSQGNLYMADLENKSVVYRTLGGEFRTLIHHPDIKWPDTFAIDPGGNLLFTDSLLNVALPGSDVGELVFPIYKVPLPVKQ